jgi:hypothetical protein
MKKYLAVFLATLVLFAGFAGSADAWSRGGGHVRGGHFHGGFHHHGFHHHGFHRGGCCWWGPGVFVGGLALGAALAYPYYAYPYPAYTPAPVVVESSPTVVYQQPAPAPTQREVVYPHGKYVLQGDGVNQAWQWVWIPTAPAPPPPPGR